MATLQIRKKSNKTWLHVPTDQAPFIISKFYVSVDGLEFQVVEQGQSKRNKYTLGNITVYDDTSGGSAETFSTITELMQRLEVLKYPAFFRDGETIEFNLIVEEDGSLPISNVNKIIFDGATVTDNLDGSVTITISGGGGGSQNLQEVLDEGATFTKSINGNYHTIIATRYADDPDFPEENTFSSFENIISDYIDGDGDSIYKETGVSKSKNSISIYGEKLNVTTQNGKSGGFVVREGVVEVIQNIESSLGQGSHKLELDPVVGEDVVFKTDSSKTSGEYVLATLDDISGGAVDSVNGQTGDVVLDAGDVGAEPTITAGTTAQYLRGDKTFQNVADLPISTATQNYVDLDENLFAIKEQYIGLMRIQTILNSVTISSSASNTNNRVIFLPFRVGKSCNIKNISLIQNAENDGASATLTVYIYDDSNGGLVGTKLHQVISSSGILTGTQKVIELFTDFDLDRGNYWIGIHCRNLNTGGTNPTFVGGNITTNSVLGTTLSYSNNQNGYYQIAGQTGDLGNNPTLTQTLTSAISLPQIFIKLSS